MHVFNYLIMVFWLHNKSDRKKNLLCIMVFYLLKHIRKKYKKKYFIDHNYFIYKLLKIPFLDKDWIMPQTCCGLSVNGCIWYNLYIPIADILNDKFSNKQNMCILYWSHDQIGIKTLYHIIVSIACGSTWVTPLSLIQISMFPG